MAELRVPKDVESYGAALRWCREQRGMTLRQLADAVGVSAAFLCDVEHDRRQTTKGADLARALGVRLADLDERQGVTEELVGWLAKQPELIAELRRLKSRETPMRRRR